MTFSRVGAWLAVLAVGTSCTQTPQSVTAPSAATGGSTAAAADGSTLKVTAPALVTPVDGARAEDRRPTLVWVNSNGRYGSIGVAYDIEVSSPTAVVYSTTVGETPEFGAHIVPFDLEYDTVYSWRTRAHLGDLLGPWSNWGSFISPAKPVVVAPPPTAPTTPGSTAGCAAPLSPMGPGETRKPRPNDSALVRSVADAFPSAFRNSCQDHGGSWEFMDRTIDALRAKDGRYGYNCKRGNCNDVSHDVASYYYAGTYPDIEGRYEVYIFDVIGGHCGATPSVVWIDVTDITLSSGTVGRTTYPRPGRSVSSCTAAATAGQ